MRMVVALLAFACVQASAQVVVRVGDAAAVTISAAEFAKLPRHTAVLNDHGKQISYEGALLHDVLAKGGVDFGSGLRGKQVSSYVAALASDGYEAVYALAECDPSLGDADILVADKREGQALAEGEGPLRVIVPHDKRPARSIKLVREIDVVQLRK